MEKVQQNLLGIDEYIASYPLEIQEKLQSLRAVIHDVAPMASEKISYGMPTFYLFGNLVHFAMQKAHIGFYPGPSGVSEFADELKGYKTSKGAIQFPIADPIPFDLVRKITAFRIEENLRWEAEKKSLKKRK
jgi:uncharacterized protein YdhG (YjbR/CyaY superfamily)